MVTVISGTIQEFQGIRYYRCGPYFQRKGKRLHIAVWEFICGPVPKGYHVHHIDHDRCNNQPDNLKLLPKGTHATHHLLERTEQSREIANRIRPLAVAWHKSDAGREWHKHHWHEFKDQILQPKDATCDQCSKGFSKRGAGRFCSNNCKSAWRRAQGADMVTKECPICAKEFQTNKYWKVRCCSRSCGTTLQHRERRASGEG